MNPSPRTVRPAALALLIVGLVAGTRCIAQERPTYKAVGAPADPKVPVSWNRYYDYAQASELLGKLAKAYPKYCRVRSLGKSYGERDMWVMTITDFGAGIEKEKPAFWIDGGIHANEIQSVEVVLYTAWYLLEMHQKSQKVGRLLDERVLYLCPMLSPDSRDAHFYKPNSTHSPRSGQRPVDDDRDGLVDEDGPDDLNDDGHITQMRIRDENGKYKPHDEFPNLLVRVKDGEKGQYALLGVEGFDNDGDGRVNEDGDGFYDPNRDWAWRWQPKYVQRGAYRYPFSILENRLVADFIMAHPNIAGAQTYHNAGGMILRGPASKSDRLDSADAKVFDVLAEQGTRILPAYRSVALGNKLYEGCGVEFDWFFQMQGVFAFTNELFTSHNLFREENAGGFAQGETAHRFNKYLLLGEGIVPWQEVEHPQHGKIEVGGMKKNWGRQPPSFLLEEECHRNMAFTLYHADQMPLVRVQSVDVKPLDHGLFQVTAVVENARTIPTRAAVDVKRKITPPDVVWIEGAGVKVVLGLKSPERFFKNPVEQKHHPARIRVDTIPGHGVTYVRWLVRGTGPYTVRVRSVKGGSDEKTTAAVTD